MPLFVKVPRNETVLRELGGYPGYLNFGRGRGTSVQAQVRRFGLAGFEAATQATLFSLVQLGRAPVQFFDVGAHVGLYSSLVSTIFPTDHARVTAFEPTPKTAEKFVRIAAANGLSVRLEQCAVAAEDGSAQLFLSDRAETSNSLIEGYRESKGVLTVPKVSLDSYCAQHDVRPHVMKIDVEAYEAQVLLGALDTIERSRPAIVCELLKVAEPTATEHALAALDRLGYRMYRWTRKQRWQPCTRDDVANHVRHVGRDWLFAPEELDERFHDAVTEWIGGIAECTPDTSVMTEKPSRALKAWYAEGGAVSAGPTRWRRLLARGRR